MLGELLAEAAERVDVRVLVWAGAPATHRLLGPLVGLVDAG